MYFLEPLYAFLKSLLLISVMAYALITSAAQVYAYFVHGEGEIMRTAPIPAYAVSMAALCLGLALFNRKQSLKTNATSTMLRAEYQTNLIDGLQLAAIGVAVVALWAVPIDSEFGFLHYTGDFFISTVIVATSIKDPVVTLFESFRELTGGVTKDRKLLEAVQLATGLGSRDFMINKTGMKILICIPKKVVEKQDLVEREKKRSIG